MDDYRGVPRWELLGNMLVLLKATEDMAAAHNAQAERDKVPLLKVRQLERFIKRVERTAGR